MINLLPIETKKSIQAARINVILQRYLVLVGIVFIFVVLVFAAGYYITVRERSAFKREHESYTNNASEYAAVDKKSKEFAANLKIAKSILSSETLFSDMIFNITKALPQGTVLTTLSLNNEMESSKMTITARTKTAQGPLQLKTALEESELFQDVSILSITNPDSSKPAEGGIERDYPYNVTLNATFAKPDTKKPAKPAAGGN